MNASTGIAAAATAVLVAGHLAAEARGAAAPRAITKVAASMAFVLLAFARAGDSPFDRRVLAGLCLSLLGDALLLSARRPAFLAGLVAFLLAHVAYAAAFAPGSATPPWAALPILAALAAVLRWLWPHLGGMKGPVVAYTLVISAMLHLALGVARWQVPAGAVLFYVSDLFVARDRFVRPGLPNRIAGLPAYYAAQLLFAAAVG